MVAQWWRNAVIYQIYPRSFADGNGDGVGDLAGVRSRLPYLRDLGVDAVWFTPWYASPQADGGYDVADYRAIDPAFGTLAEAEALIGEAAALGIRTIVDVVPNHVSDEHPWFRAALAAGPGAPERARFWFRDGSPAGEPPTGWTSAFSGGTWTRVEDGQWYLHLFDTRQPDLNWNHPDVRREHEEVLRFWFDRGVAGIRIDSATMPVKDPAFPEVGESADHPFLDRDELHDIYRGWRAVADSYADGRVLVGEIWLDDPHRFARYLRSDELHSAFNFDFMMRPWEAKQLREAIQSTLDSHAPVGAPPTWVLSNHDVTRPATRYGRVDSSFGFNAKRFDTPTDLARGERRARAAALLTAALPGTLYVYQGDELGLPEVEDLPLDALRDPMHFRSGGVDPGRDGCRVPVPWTRDGVSYGFGDGAPWLPQPTRWGSLSVAAQDADPASMLTLYRSALAMRRSLLRGEEFAWLASAEDVIAFARGDVLCVVNFGAEPVPLPGHREVLLTSAGLDGDRLPTDVAAWLRV
ncbi:glycoside hydrolase family 13 protein [Actinophytocola sp.]|uniref:glycoside hydrolase family 13 protein n=1 Tax=Actinophytocola sp. TaxID=1872138 RepID=UPI002D5BB7FA|nr:glycoside hydrolase family 13 protein [Actinophytocola sp.]HYQ66352.1 glycoside hydrolase family 13 protein [Actinophytocola sp.]